MGEYIDPDAVGLIIDVINRADANYRDIAQTIIGASLHFVGRVDSLDRVSYPSEQDDDDTLREARIAVRRAWNVVFGDGGTFTGELWPAQQLSYSSVNFPRDSDEFALHFDVAAMARRFEKRVDRAIAIEKAIKLVGMEDCVWGIAAKAGRKLSEARKAIVEMNSAKDENGMLDSYFIADNASKSAYRMVYEKSYVSEKLQEKIGDISGGLNSIAYKKRFSGENELSNAEKI